MVHLPFWPGRNSVTPSSGRSAAAAIVMVPSSILITQTHQSKENILQSHSTIPKTVTRQRQHQRQHEHVTNSLVYFHTYLNIVYYLGLSPFKIASHGHGHGQAKSYVIHKSKWQNCICCIIQLSILFQFVSLCRGLDVGLLQSDPSNYFEIANVLGTLVYYLILFPTLWCRQMEIMNIFNLVANNFLNMTSSSNNNDIERIESSGGGGDSDCDRRGNNNGHRGFKFLLLVRLYVRPVILCTIFLSWTLYTVVTRTVAVHKYCILAIPTDYAARAEFVYLFGSYSHSHNYSTYSTTATATATMNANGSLLLGLTGWYIFIEFYIWLGIYYSELLVLLCGMFVRRIIKDFIHSLHQQETTAQIALQQYLWLKKIVQQLNTAIGPLVLCVVVSALPYYASNIETIFTTPDGIRRLRISFYCIVFFSSLVIAADGNTRIGEFKDWLLDENRSVNIPQSSLYLVTHELHTFGLKGYGFFTITFGFFGTILSVLLTYSFIIVQFHSTTTTATATAATAATPFNFGNATQYKI